MTIPQVSDPAPPFGATLRQWRTQQGLSQAALARQIGVTHGAVNRWEFGDSYPSPKHRVTISRIMGGQTEEDFAALLRQIRRKRNTSVLQIAVHLGVAEATVYRWESANPRTQRVPRYVHVVAMCRVMRTMPEERAALLAAAGYNVWGQSHA